MDPLRVVTCRTEPVLHLDGRPPRNIELVLELAAQPEQTAVTALLPKNMGGTWSGDPRLTLRVFTGAIEGSTVQVYVQAPGGITIYHHGGIVGSGSNIAMAEFGPDGAESEAAV